MVAQGGINSLAPPHTTFQLIHPSPAVGMNNSNAYAQQTQFLFIQTHFVSLQQHREALVNAQNMPCLDATAEHNSAITRRAITPGTRFT